MAEITLSLLIVVIPGALAFGVLVFPLMTAAGVFAFAVRYDLEKRESELQEIRKEKTKSAATAAQVRRTASKPAASPSQSVAQVQAVPATATHYPRKCEHCDAQIKAPQSVGAHMKKHHPELCKPKVLAENFFENVLKG